MQMRSNLPLLTNNLVYSTYIIHVTKNKTRKFQHVCNKRCMQGIIVSEVKCLTIYNRNGRSENGSTPRDKRGAKNSKVPAKFIRVQSRE